MAHRKMLSSLLCLKYVSELTNATTNQLTVLALRKKQSMNSWISLPPFVQIFLLVKTAPDDFQAIQVYFNKIASVLILNPAYLAVVGPKRTRFAKKLFISMAWFVLILKRT